MGENEGGGQGYFGLLHGMTKQLEGLCPHGRHTGAVCLDCNLEADIYQPKFPDPLTDEFDNQIDWSGPEADEAWKRVVVDCLHTGGSSDYYDLPPDCTRLYDVMVAKKMEVDQENIFKAAYRWDIKPDLLYNLWKIKFYVDERLDRELSRLDKSRNASGARKKGQ